MKIYQTFHGLVLEDEGAYSLLPSDLGMDRLFIAEEAMELIASVRGQSRPLSEVPPPLAPLRSQEVWAAGVTYYRSRTARMAESKDAGGGTFYDKVYAAARPEIFFKGTASRVAGPAEAVRIRSDSKWNVPEPELTLAINARGKIFGYTIGNDMSSRDIEGENPLYLPQAKVYYRSAALGPCLLVAPEPPPRSTEISLKIFRGGAEAFAGGTRLDQIKRSFEELASFLFRDNCFPMGAFLMTGTGVVPPDGFTLQSGDEIQITIEPIGTLTNFVE